MPRFFLHVHNRIGFVEDEEGQDLPDLDAARDVAIASIRSIISEEASQGAIDLGGRVEIVDEHRRTLSVVPFADAFAVRTDQPA
jgi:hypothetical protein